MVDKVNHKPCEGCKYAEEGTAYCILDLHNVPGGMEPEYKYLKNYNGRCGDYFGKLPEKTFSWALIILTLVAIGLIAWGLLK